MGRPCVQHGDALPAVICEDKAKEARSAAQGGRQVSLVTAGLIVLRAPSIQLKCPA